MEYKELPERLNRTVIYESDYVCLYADKVKLPKIHNRKIPPTSLSA